VAVVLWHIEVSHYNEKARWALDYKGVPYQLRTPMPGMHRARALALTRGKHQRLPILDLEGRRVADSTAIIAALEEYRPEPRLYPEDPAERRRALELEDWFDEELGPRTRRLVWHHTLDDPDATVNAVFPNAGEGRKRVMRRLGPVVVPAVRRDYEVHEAGAAEALDGLRRAMDLIESEVGPEGYLVGSGFTVADLAGAALFTPVIGPPERSYLPTIVPPGLREVRDELEARAGGRWVLEMFARHRGTRVTGTSA
jgi:glutathione S-transferase